MTGVGSIPDDPSTLRIHEAAELFLDAKAVDVSDTTVRDYRYRLQWFNNWCEENGVETVADLNGIVFDRARTERAQDCAPTTVKGLMVAINQMVQYLVRIEAVEPELAERIEIPSLSDDDVTSDELLSAEDAEPLLEHFRNDMTEYGRREHVVLEVIWHTGARVGGVRALDLSDYGRMDDDGSDGAGILQFRHRPASDTPLKNRKSGERDVWIPGEVCDAIDFYIGRKRADSRDDHGRAPLFATRQGRPSLGTIQKWMYLVTQPCHYGPCPHGEDRETCKYRKRQHASKCPSSRAPHRVRTGSITWHRDQGTPLETTNERVNASPEVIAKYYDKAETRERARRRQEHTADLDILDEYKE